ncbi:MAG: hypothetical protein JSS53_07430 [Proteobacteria bacterium]|nr:hypothetical protein [Pseudomonadota bacterium]
MQLSKNIKYGFVFGILSLFIPLTTFADCPDMPMYCIKQEGVAGICEDEGNIVAGTCWNWAAFDCWACDQASIDCNNTYPACQGQCNAMTPDEYQAEGCATPKGPKNQSK